MLTFPLHRVSQRLWRAVPTLGNQLLPTRCLLCTTPLGGELLCPDCVHHLPYLDTHHCVQCALPLDSAAERCGQCLQQPPGFEHAVVPFRYAFPLDALIHNFKHKHQLAAGRALGQCLAAHIEHHYDEHPELTWPELIVPVPLHWSRRLARGYNQSDLLARQLQRALDIPVATRVCRRVRRTSTQQGLSRRQRLHNLHSAFRINPSTLAAVKGKCVALLDDVITTGSTARVVSQVLLGAGAAEVHLWALARTPEPDRRDPAQHPEA
ncbi:ComF family protein [Marinimicrobium alkaliphilum]|uniref:ComF family protein n=1 Tax=Marinimicrobium alkaliphilum TaxID=2202654 RepID=UPI000DB964EA|nr:ComF family protein [Marinimicrobium alkaliphilum]